MRVETAAFGHVVSEMDQTIAEIDDAYAEIIGRGRREVIGRQALSFTCGEDVFLNQAMLTRLAEAGQAFAITKRYHKGDGSIVWVRNQVSRLDNGIGGARLCATTTAVDSPFTASLLATRHAAAKRLCETMVVGRKLFSADIVSAPPAEVLLRLYRAELEGEALTTAMLADVIEIPAKVLHRWVLLLRERGLVEEGGGLDVPLRISRFAESKLERLLGQSI